MVTDTVLDFCINFTKIVPEYFSELCPKSGRNYEVLGYLCFENPKHKRIGYQRSPLQISSDRNSVQN